MTSTVIIITIQKTDHTRKKVRREDNLSTVQLAKEITFFNHIQFELTEKKRHHSSPLQ